MGRLISALEKYKIIEKQEHEQENEQEHEQEYKQENREDLIEDFTQETHQEVEEINETVFEQEKVENQVDTLRREEENKFMPYDRRFEIEEVYALHGLGEKPQTETVFVLENLIHALPSELTEYVKKQTVQNIIQASAMNLGQLLEDGEKRKKCIQEFWNEYTEQNTQSIEALTTEILKLSNTIKEYQQQIKNKEKMLQEQSALMKQEEEHIAELLEFFAQK